LSPVSLHSMNSKFIETLPNHHTYLGYTIDYSPTSTSPCMTLSMPNYVPAMLSRLCPSGCGSASFPAVYTPHVSYPDPSLHLSSSSTATLSNPVSPPEKTWIQQVAGSLLFYARALDLSVLTAVCQLSCHQSNPIHQDLTSAHRLLNYVSSHQNPQKTIYPSSMALWAATDASFLSRPKSGSVAGCSVGLGDPPPCHPQKATDKVKELKRPLFVPPASYNPILPLTYPTMSPTSSSTPSAYPWCLRLWKRRSMLPLLAVGKCWLSSRLP
jgi:hypothetical protein